MVETFFYRVLQILEALMLSEQLTVFSKVQYSLHVFFSNVWQLDKSEDR